MELEKRFWSKVDKGKPDECWEWKAAKTNNGYGRINISHESKPAHRVAVRLNGRDPEDKYVCHKCDNPSCVNPNHLYLGTQQDNMDDMVERRRANFGEDGPNASLTNKQVQEINDKMHEGLSNSEIAKDYPVNEKTISDIRCGVSWTHVDIENPFHETYEPESYKDKLSEEDVEEIKCRLKAGQHHKTIAEVFEITPSVVSRIKNGESYPDVRVSEEDPRISDFERDKRQGHKISEDEAAEIKSMLQKGDMYQKEIAEKFGVSRTMITQINNGKRWVDVEPA